MLNDKADHRFDEPLPIAWLPLWEFLRIPSISGSAEHRCAIHAAARWVEKRITSLGGSARVVEFASTPIVDGTVPASPAFQSDAPTLLLYAHFDVQPPGDLSKWITPPFEPSRDGRWVRARGIADDKAALFLLLKAVESLSAQGRLTANIRFMLDGEEEILGSTICDYVSRHAGQLDACIILDGPMVDDHTLLLITGTRGFANYRICVETGNASLHSGWFGGAILNAAEELMRLANHLCAHRESLRAGIGPVPQREQNEWRVLPSGSSIIRRNGATPKDEESEREFYARTLWGLSLEIVSLTSGEPPPGESNAIPFRAEMSVQLRTSPVQTIDRVCADFEALLDRRYFPTRGRITWQRTASIDGAEVIRSDKMWQAARHASSIAGYDLIRANVGGSLPLISTMSNLRIPTLMTGLAGPDTNTHGFNERLDEAQLHSGLSFVTSLISEVGGRIGGRHLA